MKNAISVQEKLDELLAQNYENEVVEFKEAKRKYEFDKIGQYFSALSNEANLKAVSSAWLVFGIRDKDKQFVDSKFKLDTASLHKLKADIANHTTNRITFIEIYELWSSNGRVILFEIPAAPKGIPVAWKGHYFGRDASELQPLNLEEIERIRAQANEVDWSAGIIEAAGLEDLAPEAIERAKHSYKTKNPHLSEAIEIWDTATFLNKAKVTIKGKITRTAILLLGKSESEHFLSPSTAKITWILKDRDNLEKDYAHFNCPLLTSSESVYGKIRNLKYRYIPDGTLFPEEVDQYDPYIIREALNNCIAHQDYTLGGKIVVVENEEGQLIFSNSGAFIPQTIEEVVVGDAPEFRYRNKFLAEAMVNLNMIDTIGSGIKKMFQIQRKKYFPLPEYDLTQNKVKVTITGKVVDVNYAKKLAAVPDLSLLDIISLDKVVKNKILRDDEVKQLKSKNLIEGRKPNFHISATVAGATGERSSYIKMRGFKDDHYKKMVLEYIEKYGSASKEDIDGLILDILPDVLDDKQKSNKVRNMIYAMSKRDKTIENKGTKRNPIWKRSLSN